jgi:hypothetical protein
LQHVCDEEGAKKSVAVHVKGEKPLHLLFHGVAVMLAQKPIAQVAAAVSM